MGVDLVWAWDMAWVEDLAWAGGWASVEVGAMPGIGTGRVFPIVDILIEDTVFTSLTVVPMGQVTLMLGINRQGFSACC